MMRRAEPPDPVGRRMTPRRRKIVEVIDDSVRRNGYAPSMREIGQAVGLASTSSVSYQLSVLEEAGYLSREARRPRTAALRAPAERRTGQARDLSGGARLRVAHRRAARPAVIAAQWR
jgi:repressor LexA